MRRLIARAFLVVVALVMTTGVVIANSSTYSWTMFYRVVDGTVTGVYHGLDAGSMTNSGSVWAFSKDPGALANPNTLTFEVWRDEFLFDSKVCSVQRTPSSTLNVVRTYSKACGSVSAGVFYLIIWKTADDGWNVKGNGTLKTQ